MARSTQPPRTGKPATIYSVAEAAGVSIASVSRALQGGANVSESVRSKVLDAAEALDYVPLGAARSLAVQRHEAHGIVLPDLTGPYYAELILGYESRAAELGQNVVIMLADRRQEPSKEVRALAARVDGLVFMGYSTVQDATVEALGASIPVVVVARDSVPGVDTIRAENTANARALTEHLLGRHRRQRLLFVGSSEGSPDTRDRYAGFVAAHAAAGLAAAEAVPSRLDEEAGVAVADRILAGELEADGLVCANDELAVAILDRLEQRGYRLPSDLSIVGWDDVMAARYVRPALTTVRQPVRQLGATAADVLHARIAGAPASADPNIMPTEIVLRSSCGCLPDEPATPEAMRRPSARRSSAQRKKDS